VAWPSAVLRSLPSHVPGHAYGAIASQQLTLAFTSHLPAEGAVTPDHMAKATPHPVTVALD